MTTIAAIRATPVTVPLEAPLLHSNGAHWGRFVRTIVEVETADGYVGLGEMGGGGEDAYRAFAALADYLRGHDVFRLEAMRFAVCNPTASLYNNRTQLHPAIEFGRGIEDARNDYYEDPVWGMPQLLRLKEFVSIPIATNTVVVNFEQLAANAEMRAVDVVLLDTTFWGGIRPCIKAAGVCETFQLGVAVHSSGELGIQLATMLHLGAVLPNLTYAGDAHYHHLVHDIIVGGRHAYRNGAIAVPDRAGLGISLDRDKLEHYRTLYRRVGGYPYDRDPGRPGWYPMVPNQNLADPTDPPPPPHI